MRFAWCSRQLKATSIWRNYGPCQLCFSEGYMLTSRLYFTIARLHVRKVYRPRTTLREAEGALLWQDTESVPVRFHPKLLIDLN
jgi:hypothetical protein